MKRDGNIIKRLWAYQDTALQVVLGAQDDDEKLAERKE